MSEEELYSGWVQRLERLIGSRFLTSASRNGLLLAGIETARFVRYISKEIIAGRIPHSGRKEGCADDCEISDFNLVVCNVEPEMVLAVRHHIAKMLGSGEDSELVSTAEWLMLGGESGGDD